MPSAEIARLGAGKYLSMTTFKRDGTAVATPVWVAPDGDHLYVITDPSSGKAKRLRNGSSVRLAPCDMRGRITGASVDGTAELLDDEGTRHALALMAARYGLTYRIIGWWDALRRRDTPHVGVRVSVP